MKILYGVQATGNGHISRSREVLSVLKSRGHDVHVIFSGRKAEELWDTEIFKPYTVFKGFSFKIKNGRMDRLGTVASLDLRQFYRDIKSFDASGFDLALVDFEPLTSRIARKYKIPVVGIGHQYAFRYDIPMVSFGFADRLLMDVFAPADYNLGLHWHHFGQPILPPIIPLMKRDKTVKNKIIAYLPFEDRDSLIDFFKPHDSFDFTIFHPVKEEEDLGHVHIRPLSRERFLNVLAESEGVITNAGFELPSESIHLGKKILMKPIRRQFEQESNALALERLKLGMVMRELDGKILHEWLHNFSSDGIVFPYVPKEIVPWLEKGRLNEIGQLSEKLWAKN